MRDRRGSVWNAVLYLSSAVFAGVAALAAAVPIYREWGRIASIAYTAGTVGALALVVGRGSERARAWLAILVLAGAAILPLGLEVAWRARTDPGFHAQSEAIVTEEAAKALLHGRDPYVADYLHGPLRARPLGTRTHFPYLPAMLVFGLPRGLSGDAAAADARVAFAVATLSIAGAAMWLARQGGSDPWGAFLFLVVLPTGALLMATGGDDLPVLASMFLAVVLAWRERIVGAGVVGGVGGRGRGGGRGGAVGRAGRGGRGWCAAGLVGGGGGRARRGGGREGGDTPGGRRARRGRGEGRRRIAGRQFAQSALTV